jgi:metal-responsive CopG/Arc/MetJ family transcriptional regulator
MTEKTKKTRVTEYTNLITFRLPVDLAQRIQEATITGKRKRSQVIRQALEKGLALQYHSKTE